MFAVVLIAMLAVGVAAYIYRDKIAALLPGAKHYIAAVGAFVLGIAQYFQTLNWADLLKDPRNAALAAAGVGLIVLILSWITPRKDA